MNECVQNFKSDALEMGKLDYGHELYRGTPTAHRSLHILAESFSQDICPCYNSYVENQLVRGVLWGFVLFTVHLS